MLKVNTFVGEVIVIAIIDNTFTFKDYDDLAKSIMNAADKANKETVVFISFSGIPLITSNVIGSIFHIAKKTRKVAIYAANEVIKSITQRTNITGGLSKIVMFSSLEAAFSEIACNG